MCADFVSDYLGLRRVRDHVIPGILTKICTQLNQQIRRASSSIYSCGYTKCANGMCCALLTKKRRIVLHADVYHKRICSRAPSFVKLHLQKLSVLGLRCFLIGATSNGGCCDDLYLLRILIFVQQVPNPSKKRQSGLESTAQI